MTSPLIILDFDGTIADTQGLIVQTMQQTIAELGLPERTKQECAAMIGLPLKETFTKLIPMSDEMGDQCRDVYSRHFNENNVPGAVPLFPHVKETIEELHGQGAVLTIATSRHRESLVAFLQEMDMEKYIRFIVCGNDIERPKPAPDMVLHILDTFNTSPNDAIVVGDAVYDILMGRSAGVRTVGVSYGNGLQEELIQAGADHIIHDFSTLKELV